MSNNGPRYQARPDAAHGCCNSASVVDTTTLNPWSNSEVVAECFDIETAQMIALALNRTADT